MKTEPTAQPNLYIGIDIHKRKPKGVINIPTPQKQQYDLIKI